MLYRYVCSEFTCNSLGSGVFWYIIILYNISYIKFLGIVMHLHLVGSQTCVKKYTKKSTMSNDGSMKSFFLNNRQMKSNFSGIIYIKWISYYVTSTAAIKTARMCHTELWQSTYVEMQNIVHHDKATAYQVTDALELDPSKKCRILHSHCECIAHCKKMHVISYQTFLLYQTTALHACIFSF